MSAADRALVRGLLARAGAGATLLAHAQQPWASLTFEGQRHRLELALPAAAVTTFAQGLEEAELPLPGHILADVAIDTREALDDGRTRLRLSALTLRGA